MNATVPMSKMHSQSIQTVKATSSISLIQSSTSLDPADIAHVDMDEIVQNRLYSTIMTETEEKSTNYSFSALNETATPSNIDESIEDDDIPTLALLLSFSEIDEDVIFQNNGYQKIDKICDTLQGQLLKAMKIDTNSTKKPKYVAIKKTDKRLFYQRIAVQDDFNFCVSENILKESIILKYLTADNQPIGDYIVKYIDFFESDTDYYLVMEYIESGMNLKQFITVCHEYIKNDKLAIKEYNKMVKYLLWQLFVTIQWLHIKMHCCHLDLCTENIMLSNVHFISTKHGISIDPNVSVKLSDFGVSEVFKAAVSDSNITSFLCEKHGLSLENEAYFAPNVFNGDIFDARCADNWSLGMIMFECMTGKHLYGAMDININSIQSAYWALHHKKLKRYLKTNNLLKHFNLNSFDLLNGLLNVDEHQRLKGMHILKHKWFKMYYHKYCRQLLKKLKHSNKRNINEYTQFPFYH